MMDAEIISEFVEESREHLGDIEIQLLSIEALGEDIDDDLVNTVFRAIHSIKGAAGFLGLTQINEVAHRLENVLMMIREHRLVPDPYNVDVMLKAADCLSGLIENIETSNETDNVELCEKLDVVINGNGAPPSGDEESASEPTAAAAEDGSATEDTEPSEPVDESATAEAPKAESAEQRIESTVDKVEQAINAAASDKPEAKAVIPAKKSEPRPAADPTIRVSVRVLDHLMNLAGELVLSRNQLLRSLSEKHEATTLDKIASGLDQVTTELQESIMQTRMQPIGNVFSKFPRVIRDLSSSLGKSIDLKMEGVEVETDKTIVEAIADPLTHLIRNSCDHGIETPEKRRAKGKPETGNVRLRAFHQAGKVMIEIIDDGAGMCPDTLKAKAVEKGVLTEEAASHLSDHDAVNLIFAPGFSTAEAVTEVSGRGVGMDVVRTNIEKIGGGVEVESQLGHGSTIRITLPLTLAIVPSMIVSVAGRPFALPQVNILELVQTGGLEKRVERVNNAEVLRLRGTLLPLVRLNECLGIEHESGDSSAENSDSADREGQQFVVVESGRSRFAIGVDRVLDSEEIVVKPLGRHLKHLPLFAGSTILGDGRVAMILDVSGITTRSGIATEVESLDDLHATTEDQEADFQRMVMLSLNDDDHFAVSMDVVSRIERVRSDEIETIGKHRMIQYRGASLSLVGIEEGIQVGEIETPEYVHLVVYSVYGHEVGLIAPHINDIAECDLQFSEDNADSKGVVAISVINDRMTRILDIYGLTEMARPDWFKTTKTAQEEPLEDRPHRILVNEDSKFFRNFLITTLLEEGHRVDSFEDGELGWQHLETCDCVYDLLLTDIEMPNLDGLGFTKRVRESEKWGDIPVIALTSLADKNSIGRGIDAGVTDYQIKMNKPELLNAIKRFGGGKHSQFKQDLITSHSHLEEVS